MNKEHYTQTSDGKVSCVEEQHTDKEIIRFCATFPIVPGLKEAGMAAFSQTLTHSEWPKQFRVPLLYSW